MCRCGAGARGCPPAHPARAGGGVVRYKPVGRGRGVGGPGKVGEGSPSLLPQALGGPQCQLTFAESWRAPRYFAQHCVLCTGPVLPSLTLGRRFYQPATSLRGIWDLDGLRPGSRPGWASSANQQQSRDSGPGGVAQGQGPPSPTCSSSSLRCPPLLPSLFFPPSFPFSSSSFPLVTKTIYYM